MSKPLVGYAGLGAMGTPMASNLAKHLAGSGHPPLLIWNRSVEKAQALNKEASSETQVVDAIEIIAEKCDIVFTSVMNDQAAEEVYGKLFGAAQKKVIFADQSTLLPATVSKLEQDAKAKGCIFLSCPVFGQPPAAKAKQLICLVSGDNEGREKVKPLLDGLGKKTLDVGDDVKKGASLKLLGNMTLLGIMQLLGEVYTLGDAVGFDASTIHELYPPPLLVYSNKISHGTFGMPGFRVDGGLKDSRHILSLRDDLPHPCPLPTLETAYKNLRRAKDSGISDLDWSTLTLAIREDAGLERFSKGEEEAQKSAPPM